MEEKAMRGVLGQEACVKIDILRLLWLRWIH